MVKGRGEAEWLRGGVPGDCVVSSYVCVVCHCNGRLQAVQSHPLVRLLPAAV